jgi:hypothetical protein
VVDGDPTWKSSEPLAWTDHDGPGRGPSAGGRALWFAVAAVLAAVFSGLVFWDVLCPEHRAWVQVLGVVAMFGTATSVVALVRGWAGAPVLTLVSAAAGVAIGVIDAAHDPARGWFVAVAFAVSVMGGLSMYVRQVRLARWEWDAADESTSRGSVDELHVHAGAVVEGDTEAVVTAGSASRREAGELGADV